MINQSIFAVAGNPVMHSKSPSLFKGAYNNQYGCYFRLHTLSVDRLWRVFNRVGMKGMNITAPFKQEIVSGLSYLSPEVEKLGVANTIVSTELGIEGYNSDPQGVRGAVLSVLGKIKKKIALVAGNGGAARAAVYAMQKEGLSVVVLGRNSSKLEAFARSLSCDYDLLDNIHYWINRVGIIINTLPPDVTIWSQVNFLPHQIMLDATYYGASLAQYVKSFGVIYIPGQQWLFNQAVQAFNLFTHQQPLLSGMKRELNQQNRCSKLALIGFSGCGKSSVGPLLAQKLGVDFIDLDDYITQIRGVSPADILRFEGEDVLRNLEYQILVSLKSRANLLISCGGGVTSYQPTGDLLRDHYCALWLDASLEYCLDGLDISQRPMLQHGDLMKMAVELYNKRKFDYARCAHTLFDIDKLPVVQISDIIYDALQKAR